MRVQALPSPPIPVAGPIPVPVIVPLHLGLRGLHRNLRGIGDTPGCGPASVTEALTNLVNTGAFTDPAAYGGGPLTNALASEAAAECQVASGNSWLGCPPMAGCDPQSIAAAAAALAPTVQQTGPAYGQGFAPAPATYWSGPSPNVTSVAYSTNPAVFGNPISQGPLTQPITPGPTGNALSPSQGGNPVGSPGDVTVTSQLNAANGVNTGTPAVSGVTDWITANWPLLAVGAGAVFLLMSMRGGK